MAVVPLGANRLGRGPRRAIVAGRAQERLVRHRRAVAAGRTDAARHLARARHERPQGARRGRAHAGVRAHGAQRAERLALGARRAVVGRLARDGGRRPGGALGAAGARDRGAAGRRAVVAGGALDGGGDVGGRRGVGAVVPGPARQRDRRSLRVVVSAHGAALRAGRPRDAALAPPRVDGHGDNLDLGDGGDRGADDQRVDDRVRRVAHRHAVVGAVGDAGEGQVPEEGDVARVGGVDGAGAEGALVVVGRRGLHVALAGRLDQRPDRRLKVAGRDRSAARVRDAPPDLGVGGDRRLDKSVVHEVGDLVQMLRPIDVGDGRRVGDHILVRVHGAVRVDRA